MDKSILKKIAKDWAKSILLETNLTSFDADSLLTLDEQNYVLAEVVKLAEKLTKDPYEPSLRQMISKYYESEE